MVEGAVTSVGVKLKVQVVEEVGERGKMYDENQTLVNPPENQDPPKDAMVL